MLTLLRLLQGAELYVPLYVFAEIEKHLLRVAEKRGRKHRCR